MRSLIFLGTIEVVKLTKGVSLPNGRFSGIWHWRTTTVCFGELLRRWWPRRDRFIKQPL